jgi:hypothetical protein
MHLREYFFAAVSVGSSESFAAVLKPRRLC